MELPVGQDLNSGPRLKDAENHSEDHDVWFRAKVDRGLEQLDRGESISHEEVGQLIERLFSR